ncbi:MAG: hypothetical protein LUE31_06610 [Lachnospiraceae bacterium]|nr:hypothetical protein [Lachnospiraceae bacterium]
MNTRSGDCLVVLISDESMERDSVCDQIAEEMYLEDEYRSLGSALRVVNYLSYGKNGMIQVVNYRLVGVIGKEQANGK